MSRWFLPPSMRSNMRGSGVSNFKAHFHNIVAFGNTLYSFTARMLCTDLSQLFMVFDTRMSIFRGTQNFCSTTTKDEDCN